MRLLRALKEYLCPLSAVLINCSDFSKEDISAMPKALGLQPQHCFDPIAEQQHYLPGFLLKLSTQKQTNSPAKRQGLALSGLSAGWRLLGDRPGCLRGHKLRLKLFPRFGHQSNVRATRILRCLIGADSLAWSFSQLQPWQGHSLPNCKWRS